MGVIERGARINVVATSGPLATTVRATWNTDRAAGVGGRASGHWGRGCADRPRGICRHGKLGHDIKTWHPRLSFITAVAESGGTVWVASAHHDVLGRIDLFHQVSEQGTEADIAPRGLNVVEMPITGMLLRPAFPQGEVIEAVS